MPKRATAEPKNVKKRAATQLGAKGGKTTAKRMTQKDPDYYKRIAAMVATRII
jgi:hypothetical protein